MEPRKQFPGILISSGVLGGFGASFLFVLWTALFEPVLFGDGQYAFAFLVTFPFGWLVGSLAGLGAALTNKRVENLPKARVVALYVIGGVLLTPFPGMVAMTILLGVVGLLIEWFKGKVL